MMKWTVIGMVVVLIVVAGVGYYFWLGRPAQVPTPTPTATPTPTPTPKPASGKERFHYEGRKHIGSVDEEQLKLSLDLVYGGSVDLAWDVNNTVVESNDVIELRAKGQGELNANLIIDGEVTLKGTPKEIHVEVPLGKLLVPKPEGSLSVTVPVDGIPVTITVNYRADLIHQAGISTEVLEARVQTSPDQIVGYALTVVNPENAQVTCGQRIDLTVSTSIDAGVLGSADLPPVTRQVLPKEEPIVLITLQRA